jgi:hypothetical protein
MKRWLRISQVFGAYDIADEEAIDSTIGGCKTRPTDCRDVGELVRRVSTRRSRSSEPRVMWISMQQDTALFATLLDAPAMAG